MNILSPVSSIMTKDLITVSQDDSLETVRDVFSQNNIHHIPVVRFTEIVGILSMTDFQHFMHGFAQNDTDRLTEEVRLRAWKVSDIMTKGLAKLDISDPIRTALEVFKTNRIHALPVTEGDALVGIVTTHDIIKLLADEPVTLSDYQSAK